MIVIKILILSLSEDPSMQNAESTTSFTKRNIKTQVAMVMMMMVMVTMVMMMMVMIIMNVVRQSKKHVVLLLIMTGLV